MSTFTPNKAIEQPASGSYNDAWATPVNNDWAIIDSAFGGTTTVSVTGISSNIALSTAQYTPPNIEITGVLSQSLTVQVPSGVGGFWSVYNNTSGTYNLTFATVGGGSYVVPQGQRAFLISDGANMQLAQSLQTPFSDITGQIANSQVPVGAVTQWEASLSIGASQITGTIAAAQVGALPASQITSGVFSNARIPAPGSLNGVYIVPDPGGGYIPTGGAGDIFYYY